ncbi:BTB And C-terminal Kelch [Tyrophagus putrescentiae]|nr:BTB And C-terminal Kelch [Tyrophagus putrescentiae]
MPPHHLSLSTAQAFFQKFIEDHFEVVIYATPAVPSSVLGSDLFQVQDEGNQARGQTVLDCAHQYAALIFKDGHGLQYSKALTAFRPRATRQLLMVAGGWVDGKTTSLTEVTTLDGRIYAIDGFYQQDRVKKCEGYGPTTDLWTAIADLNYSRSDAIAVSHSGRIYVAVGVNDNTIESSVEVYCPVSDRWQLVKVMASLPASFSLTSFDGRK